MRTVSTRLADACRRRRNSLALYFTFVSLLFFRWACGLASSLRQSVILSIVSFASRYVTLLPGDVIFTGTPGRTQALSDGDTIEIELEGVGVLSNPVKQLKE